jgi:hypothetical protein
VFGIAPAFRINMKYLTTLILGTALIGVGFSTGCTVSHESSDKPGLLGGENHSSSTEVKDLNGNPIIKSDTSSHTSN